MNYKDLLVPELRDYNGMKKSLKNIEAEIKVLLIEFGALKASSYDKDVVDVSENHQQDKLLDNIAHREYLTKHHEFVTEKLNHIDETLDQLNDQDRDVLKTAYIERPVSWASEISERYFVEQSTAYNMRNGALRRYAILRLGVIDV